MTEVAGTAGADYPRRGRAWWMIIVLASAAVVSVLDRGVLDIVVDPVRADLGLSDVQVSLLQGLAFALFYATVGVPLGLAADRFSRRGLVIGGILVWSVATVGAGFAGSFGTFFLARLLVGLGEAALAPAAVSLIADLFPPPARGRPISVFVTGQSLASGLAISITSLLTAAAAAGRFAGIPFLGTLAPWRLTFEVCGACGFLVVAALLTTVEPARRAAPAPRRLAAQARMSLGFLARNGRVFLPLYFGFALCFLGVYGTAAWAPTMLLREFGATRVQIGAWLGPLALGFSAVGPPVGGLLVDALMRRGRSLARFGILVAAPLCIIPAALAAFAPSLLLAIVLVASLKGFAAVIGTTMLAVLQSIVPASMRGLAISLTLLSNTMVGAASGPLLVSLLTEHLYRDPARVGWSIATVAIPALVLGSLLYARAAAALRREVRDGGPMAALMRETAPSG